MKDFALHLIRQIVDNPDQVTISEAEGETGSILLTVKVGREDMGKVIGKGGKTIQAIRDVVKILALKKMRHVELELAE